MHHIRRWAAQLHGAGLAPRSIALTLSAWRGLYRWLGGEGLVAANPVEGVRAPRAAQPLPKALSVDDAVALVAHRDEAARRCWRRAMPASPSCSTAAACGSASWSGSTSSPAPRRPAGSTPPTPAPTSSARAASGAACRWASPRCRRWQAWLAQRGEVARPGEPALFVSRRGTRLTPSQVRSRLKAQALAAGLPTHVHPHMLRHSFASHVLQSSGDLRAVQELLGHANITTTQVYTKLDFGHLSKVYDAAHPRAKKRGEPVADDNDAGVKTIRIRAGKERSLQRRHPWVFEGSVAGGKADSGETVRVEGEDGRFLAWAAYSPQSSIRLRAWSFDEAERIDAAFFARRIAAAVATRARLPIASDGVRLVHGEADGLPGLVVDRYGDAALGPVPLRPAPSAGRRRSPTRCSRPPARRPSTSAATPRPASARAWRRRPAGCAAARGRRLRPRSRSASTSGASASTSPAATRPASISTSATTASSSPRRVRHFGFAEVLNCYCYTGGFSVAALAGGAARVIGVDSSGPALERATRQRRPERLRCGAPRAARRRRQPDAAGDARRRPQLRRDRPRPAEARPDRRPCRARRPRLQGHQPARASCCCGPAARSSPSPARAASRPTCSTRSSPAPGSTPASTAWSTPGSGAAPDHPMTVTFPGGRVPEGPGDPETLAGRAGS